MREHPILFSSTMVRALLAGRKSVTRRLSSQWLKVKAGDRLWVRETWGLWDRYMTRQESIDAGIPVAPHALDAENCPEYWKKRVIFRADGEPDPCNTWHWHPSIHMPRWASRILLECDEDARLERLQEITTSDAQLEGMESCTPYDQFRALWGILHTKPGERWEDNPGVVRVGKFRRIA